MISSIHNPYYNIGAINDLTLFFNRFASTEILLSALFSGRPQCRSIVGQRKIGKTSLVQYLSRPEIIQSFDFTPANYLFVYFNCQKNPSALKSANSFYQELINQLFIELSDPLKKILFNFPMDLSLPNLGNEWERILRRLREEKVQIIIIFDEFEKAIVSEPLIKEGLFGSLRAYTQDNPNFAWITCTMSYLHNLFEEAFDAYNVSAIQRKSESDFYNIATTHVVGLFEKTDTLKLITSPAKSNGIDFSSVDIERIIRFGGNFPYFIQRACYHLFNAYLKGKVENGAIFQKCIKEATPFWEDYWNKLEPGQQELLFSVAAGEYTEDIELERLKDLSLVYENEDGKILPFSLDFACFVLQQNPKINHKKGKEIEVEKIDPSETEVEILLNDIKIAIETSEIEEKFKKLASYDLKQARVAYKSQAYKACVIMLGAVLEGLMLGTLRREEVLDRLKTDSNLSNKIQLKGGIRHPDYSDKTMFADAIANQLDFEKFKYVVSNLIPNLETLKIEGIQQFRNAIHPWKGIQEPSVYAEFNHARAITHISSLHILVHHILSWNP